MASGYIVLFLSLFLRSVSPAPSAPGASRFNFSSSAPHVFADTFGLLQQWPNTFYPYGHTIAPCEVPINTNLYHARLGGDLPPSPEWFAFDADMSYSIAGTRNTSHLSTYRTVKKVKCIYFNGASAALNSPSNMDSQMVFIYNNSAAVPDVPLFGPWPPANDTSNNRTSGDPNGPMLGAEYRRAEALCSFIKEKGLGGPGWGYEGIIRMNAGFEMIWCDFDSPSVRLVSHLNVSAPSLDLVENVLPAWESATDGMMDSQGSQKPLSIAAMRPQELVARRFWKGSHLGWLTATSHQYGFSGGKPGRGEVRVKLEPCGMFSFYDLRLEDQEFARTSIDQKTFNLSSNGTWLAPKNAYERNEALRKLTRRRQQHQILNVSVEDGVYMRSSIEDRLRALLDPSKSVCSGIDWHEITQGIVMAYSTNLHDFLKLLRGTPDHRDVQEWLIPRRAMAHMLMMPFYEYPPEEMIERSPPKAFALGSKGARDAFSRCQDQFSPDSTIELSGSETLIHAATRDVLGSICGTILNVFLSIEALWFTATLSATASSTSSLTELDKMRGQWGQEVEELMAWLGWADQWTSCEPGCGLGQVCCIPIWPLSFLGRPGFDGGNKTGRRPPPRGPPPGRPGHGYGHGPGYGYGYGYRGPPPGYGRWDDQLLWEPKCVNRTQLLV